MDNSANTTVHIDNIAAISKGHLKEKPKHEENIWLSNNKWRMIYEVIHNEYFDKSKLSPDEFLHYCKDDYNRPKFIPK